MTTVTTSASGRRPDSLIELKTRTPDQNKGGDSCSNRCLGPPSLMPRGLGKSARSRFEVDLASTSPTSPYPTIAVRVPKTRRAGCGVPGGSGRGGIPDRGGGHGRDHQPRTRRLTPRSSSCGGGGREPQKLGRITCEETTASGHCPSAAKRSKVSITVWQSEIVITHHPIIRHLCPGTYATALPSFTLLHITPNAVEYAPGVSDCRPKGWATLRCHRPYLRGLRDALPAAGRGLPLRARQRDSALTSG